MRGGIRVTRLSRGCKVVAASPFLPREQEGAGVSLVIYEDRFRGRVESSVGHVDPQSPHLPGQADDCLQLGLVEDVLMGAGAQGGQCL